MQIQTDNTLTHIPEAIRGDLVRLRESVGRAVGSVFFGKLLETMRSSGLKGQFGHGGRGEEVFSAQLHGILAERIGMRMGGGPAEAIYRMLERQQLLIGGQDESGGQNA